MLAEFLTENHIVQVPCEAERRLRRNKGWLQGSRQQSTLLHKKLPRCCNREYPIYPSKPVSSDIHLFDSILQPGNEHSRRNEGWLQNTSSQHEAQIRPEYRTQWIPPERTLKRTKNTSCQQEKRGWSPKKHDSGQDSDLLGFFGGLARKHLTALEAREAIVDRVVGAQRHEERIYVIGGRDFHKQPSRTVEMLDMTCLGAGWSFIDSLCIPRVSPACCAVYEVPTDEDTVMGARIYIAGGVDQYGHRLKSCESYDPANDKWFLEASMKTARSSAMCCSFGEKVFVVGGESGTSEGVLRSMEILDTSTNQWTEGPALPQPRAAAVCGLLKDRFFIVAGGKGSDFVLTTSTFCYDLHSGEWNVWGALPEPVECAASACIDQDKLFVLGGFSPELSDDVFMLNTTTKRWQKLKLHLQTPIHSLSGCAVEGGVLITGGVDPIGLSRQTTIIDPDTGHETPLPILNSKRNLHGCVCLRLHRYSIVRAANGARKLKEEKLARIRESKAFKDTLAFHKSRGDRLSYELAKRRSLYGGPFNE